MNSVFSGKNIVVTGGAGAFGQKFIKQIAETNPASLKIFSRDEMKHAAVKRTPPFKDLSWLRYQIGDICRSSDLRRAFRGADLIVHAGAMKHLPECEANVEASTRINVGGTQNVVDAFLDSTASDLVFLSTDKVAYASSVYGAQKYIGEKLVTEAALQQPGKRAYSMRYSNVVDSTGAVFHIFCTMLKEGKTPTVNGSQTTRGFVTQREVISAIEASLNLARGAEVFVMVPKIIRIAEMAEVICRILGRGAVNVQDSLGVLGEKESATLIMSEERPVAQVIAGLGFELKVLDFGARHTEFPKDQLGADGFTLDECATLSGAELEGFLRSVMVENGVI